MRSLRRTGHGPRPAAVAALVVGAALTVGGCGDGWRDDLSDDERARAVEIGSAAANALAGTLGPRLMAALDRGGPAHAVVFCSGRAQALTDSVGNGIPDGIAVGRTSLRVRNPANAPDPLDRQVLQELEDAGESDVLPSEVVRAGPPGEVRYYRPLVVTDACLGCHGPLDELDPDVRDVLRVRYPDDEAVGYGVGDVRGAIRVRIPRSELGPGRVSPGPP